MDQKFKQAKQVVREFIRMYWDDQKLTEVLAFAQDGKMTYVDPCGCLLGVTKAVHLHTRSTACNTSHYSEALNASRFAQHAEQAFHKLDLLPYNQEYYLARLNARMVAIIKAEIRRRDRLKAPKGETVDAISLHAN
jgi:hypothetical protein